MLRRAASTYRGARKRQRGAALLLTLALVGLLISAFVVVLVNDLVRQNLQQRQTSDALARAKEALIAHAVSVNLDPAPPCTDPVDCVRPGDLPCPDLNDDGQAEGSCGGALVATGQSRRLGRLPWKTLGLPDLRDGDGERLWYAVSNNFKNTPRTPCSSVGASGCLNSETPGSITFMERSGTLVNDGSAATPPSGLVAVIIAPGAILQRHSAASAQDRSCAGGSCSPAGDATGECTSSPYTNTAKCDPLNYLDHRTGVEDNAAFTDGSSFDGFINGPVYVGSRLVINDRVLPVKHDDLLPPVERRVAREIKNCLQAYSATSHNRYPWAASITASGGGDYSGQQNHRMGRIPETFDQSLLGVLPAAGALAGIVNTVCAAVPALCMRNSWPDDAAAPACLTSQGTWWRNWKEQVFYAAAADYRPDVPGFSGLPTWLLETLGLSDLLDIATPVAAPDECPPADANACLTVNHSPNLTADKRLVVIVAGRRLSAVAGGQPRGTVAQKGNVANYLEGVNAGNNPTATTNFSFLHGSRSSTFNDTVEYQ